MKSSSLLTGILFYILIQNLSFASTDSTNTPVTKPLLDKGKERIEQNQSAQAQINTTADKSQSLTKEYMEELKLVKNLTLYNQMLDKQLSAQKSEIDVINHSIANATLIERQILPLLDRMVSHLSQFIALDTPFLIKERTKRVNGLKDLLLESKLTTSEKARRVFEAYQIENEFGYTIEAYKGNVTLSDKTLAVEFLRIGRIALLYRDMAGEQFGFWNNQTTSWQTLDESQYKRYIDKGLKIAKEEIAPELITIPLLVDLERH